MPAMARSDHACGNDTVIAEKRLQSSNLPKMIARPHLAHTTIVTIRGDGYPIFDKPGTTVRGTPTNRYGKVIAYGTRVKIKPAP